MSIEAMKNALAFLKEGNFVYPTQLADDLRQAIEQAEQAQPVAWMHTKLEGVVVPHRPADLDRHPDRWEGLHKTPPPCPTCEALARTVMMDQTAHDTPPRKPLTDEEIWKDDGIMSANSGYGATFETLRELVRAIEAAHGIKGEA